jgi:hypothetical protein
MQQEHSIHQLALTGDDLNQLQLSHLFLLWCWLPLLGHLTSTM